MNGLSSQSRVELVGSREHGSPGGPKWLNRLVASALILLILLVGLHVADPPEMWRHLNSGRYIAEHGLPDQDPFTVIGANRRWVNPSWLFDLSLYFVFVAGGEAGLIALRLILTALLAIALLAPLRREHPVALIFPVVLAVLAWREAFGLSPTLPGMIFLAVTVSLLRQWERQPSFRTAVWLCLLQALWTNTTATFGLGALYVALGALGVMIDTGWNVSDAKRGPSGQRYSGLTLAVGLSTLANPYGLDVWKTSWSECSAAFLVDPEGQPLVSGLAPLWAVSWSSPAFVSFALLLITAIGAILRCGLRLGSLCPTAFLAVIAIADIRLLPLTAVGLVRVLQFALADFCARTAPGWSGRRAGRFPALWAGGVFLVAAALFLLMVVREFPAGFKRVRRQMVLGTPAQARNGWLSRGELTGAVLTLRPSDAGWLVWANPRMRPVLDDRLGLFADDYATYRRFCFDVIHDRHNSYRRTDGSTAGWRQLYNQLSFDWIVSQAGDLETNMMLGSSTYWAPVFWDGEVVIFGLKQTELAQDAAKRLDRLRGTGLILNDNIPVLFPPHVDLTGMIPETGVGRTYSCAEFLAISKVYFALDCPGVAHYCLLQVNDPKLEDERNYWIGKLAEMRERPQPLTVQDPIEQR